MGQEEINQVLNKEIITDIHQLQEQTGIGRRSLEKSLERMRDKDEVIIVRIKKKFFYINPEIKCHT